MDLMFRNNFSENIKRGEISDAKNRTIYMPNDNSEYSDRMH